MANLIIKPTSGGSLILQDEGGTAANTIDASGNTQLAGTLGVTGASTLTGNATLSGTANTLGTASGILTLNDGSVLNHDAQENSWFGYTSAEVTVSNAVVDFATQRHVGSNITEAAGRYTVSVAGVYLLSCELSNAGTNTTTIDCKLRINASSGTDGDGTRIYQNRQAENYMGKSWTVVVILSASDIVDIHGTAVLHDKMCIFSGIRIGAAS